MNVELTTPQTDGSWSNHGRHCIIMCFLTQTHLIIDTPTLCFLNNKIGRRLHFMRGGVNTVGGFAVQWALNWTILQSDGGLGEYVWCSYFPGLHDWWTGPADPQRVPRILNSMPYGLCMGYRPCTTLAGDAWSQNLICSQGRTSSSANLPVLIMERLQCSLDDLFGNSPLTTYSLIVC